MASKGPRFDSQQLHGSSQPSVTPLPEHPKHCKHIQTHMQTKQPYTLKKRLEKKMARV